MNDQLDIGDAPVRYETNLTIPYPPSANRYWRKTRTGQLYVSDEAKEYKAEVSKLLAQKGVRALVGDVEVIARWYRPAKRGDTSNRIKIMEDVLNGFAWLDDEQVAHWDIWRDDTDAKNPRVELRIVGHRGFHTEREVAAFVLHQAQSAAKRRGTLAKNRAAKKAAALAVSPSYVGRRR